MKTLNMKCKVSSSHSAAYIPWPQKHLLLPKACLRPPPGSCVPPFDLPHLTNYLSLVYAPKDSGTAASVSQLRLHGTLFPKIYMISLLSLKSMLKTHFKFLVSRLAIAEMPAPLSLHLHSVAQY